MEASLKETLKQVEELGDMVTQIEGKLESLFSAHTENMSAEQKQEFIKAFAEAWENINKAKQVADDFKKIFK